MVNHFRCPKFSRIGGFSAESYLATTVALESLPGRKGLEKLGKGLGPGLLDPIPVPLPHQEHDVTGLVNNRRKQTRDVPPEHAHVKGLGSDSGCVLSPPTPFRKPKEPGRKDRLAPISNLDWRVSDKVALRQLAGGFQTGLDISSTLEPV